MAELDINHHSRVQLHEAVRQTLHQYFSNLDGEDPRNVYNLVLAQIEKPLLEIVMLQTRSNQSKAAVWLGLSRNTLRKLLDKYNLT